MKINKMKKCICLCLGAIMLFSASMTTKAATVQKGAYPTRTGVILVTPDAYKNLIPTGHAAMVLNKSLVVESLSSGVVIRSNNWKSTKKTVYGVTVKATTCAQDTKAAQWCTNQIGKPYNWNYFDTTTRKKFYCSHLIWAAYLDLYQINMNTNIFGKAVHPMELVYSSKTSTIYYYSK